MNNLSLQQWKPQNDPLTSLTGVQVSIRLIQHLVGISTDQEELDRAKGLVGSAKVGESIQDAYGTSYVRIR